MRAFVSAGNFLFRCGALDVIDASESYSKSSYTAGKQHKRTYLVRMIFVSSEVVKTGTDAFSL